MFQPQQILRSIIGRFIFFFYVVFAPFWSNAVSLPGDDGAQGGEVRDESLVKLLASVQAFQQAAQVDFGNALLTFSDGWGMERMHAMDVRIWDVERSQLGWRLFFQSAFHVVALVPEPEVVAIYNPFCDLFLIAAWQDIEGIYKIVDAEMVSGDWVRDQDEGFDGVPLWLRGSMSRAEALAQSVGVSVVSFERVFDGAARSNWRGKLPLLSDMDALNQFNDPVVTIMLNQYFNMNAAFALAKDPSESLTVIRKAVVDAIDGIVDEGVQSLLARSAETVDATRKRLMETPVAWFENLIAAAVVTDATASTGLVFLSPHDHARGCMVLKMVRHGVLYTIDRIDLIDYQFCYEQTKLMNGNLQNGGLR